LILSLFQGRGREIFCRNVILAAACASDAPRIDIIHLEEKASYVALADHPFSTRCDGRPLGVYYIAYRFSRPLPRAINHAHHQLGA
jgi:hypothetical protein